MEYIKDYNKDFEEHDEENRKKENEFYKNNQFIEYENNNDFNTINNNKILKNFNPNAISSNNNIFSTQFSGNNPNLQKQMDIMEKQQIDNRYLEEE